MSNCKPINPMALDFAVVGAGISAFQQSKIKQAREGTKDFTKPKTIFGKLIGGISGRTEAAKITSMNKTAPISDKVNNSMAQSNRTGVSGGLSFGGEAARKTYLPFAIVAGVVAIFYAMRRKKGGRRRY